MLDRFHTLNGSWLSLWGWQALHFRRRLRDIPKSFGAIEFCKQFHAEPQLICISVARKSSRVERPNDIMTTWFLSPSSGMLVIVTYLLI